MIVEGTKVIITFVDKEATSFLATWGGFCRNDQFIYVRNGDDKDTLIPVDRVLMITEAE